MIFRQLFEPQSCTYTYLIGCPESRHAVLIDPVLETVERDLEVLRNLGLTLAATVETHVHADHLTSALKLRALTDSQIIMPAGAGVGCADMEASETAPVKVGRLEIKPLFTPGHTGHHLSFLIADSVMTGDSLLIDACGRTDFQGGDAVALLRGVRDKLFTLPSDTLVYPGHDYQGRWVSSIGQEKGRNPRLGGDVDEAAFVEIMDKLNLPSPKRIDLAVPANLLCGQCPETVPADMERLCEVDVQG